MVADTEKVKDLIRKLLNTARDDAATEGEIDNALRFAKSMMEKHHLDEEDLAEEPADQWEAIEAAARDQVFVSVGGKYYTWENWLAPFCAQFVGGVGVYKEGARNKIARDHRGIVILNEEDEPYKGVRYSFYGIAEDAYMAAELFHELRLTIRAMARLRWGTCYTKDGGKYAEGFVVGLYTKINIQKEEQKRLAQQEGSRAMILIERRDDLIVRKTETAKRWLSKTVGIKLSKGVRTDGANGSAQAYREGRVDGEQTDVTTARRPKLQ